MKLLTTLLVWVLILAVAAVAALNWSTLMALAPIDLVITVVQVPLGAALLGLAGGLALLFVLFVIGQQFSALRETKKLLKEIQRVQDLADKAEASRIEALQQSVTQEFRRLNDRLDARPGASLSIG